MSTRKCMVCNGTGSMWGTPPLTVDNLPIKQGNPDFEALESGYTRLDPESYTAASGYGLQVTCWQCLGKGYRPDDKQDIGDANG